MELPSNPLVEGLGLKFPFYTMRIPDHAPGSAQHKSIGKINAH